FRDSEFGTWHSGNERTIGTAPRYGWLGFSKNSHYEKILPMERRPLAFAPRIPNPKSRIPSYYRHRLRREAQHPALAGRAGLKGNGGASADFGRRYSENETGWHFPFQWARRSGGNGEICR